MSARKAKTKLLLTQRALSDIGELETYSIAQWGRPAASKYLGDIQAALLRVREKPDLLWPEADFHPQLCFYRVNKHLLVCDRQEDAVFLLTVIHASRDIPSRLAELQPTLADEAQLLHRQLQQRNKRRR